MTTELDELSTPAGRLLAACQRAGLLSVAARGEGDLVRLELDVTDAMRLADLVGLAGPGAPWLASGEGES